MQGLSGCVSSAALPMCVLGHAGIPVTNHLEDDTRAPYPECTVQTCPQIAPLFVKFLWDARLCAHGVVGCLWRVSFSGSVMRHW